MARTLSRVTGTGTGGIILEGETLEIVPHWQPMKHALDILMLNTLFRNNVLGGSREVGFTVNADGDYDLPGWIPFEFDNTGTQVSGFTDPPANGATLTRRVRFLLRVSDAAISITPKMRYGTTFGAIAVAGSGTVATISGESACSETDAEYDNAASQYQSVTLTLPTGVTLWKPQVTVAGTGGQAYDVWALALGPEIFVQST